MALRKLIIAETVTHKKLNTSIGEVEIEAPRDRDGSFEPRIIPKRSKDVSGIEDKVLTMYAKGMSQRDIAETIEEIYGFEISHDTGLPWQATKKKGSLPTN